jgi:HPt (histidine-containing phosphotransfer) domain-containing protein
MFKAPEELRRIFCREAAERLERVDMELRSPPNAAALDRIHQEFDSLAGACRAVNFRCLERCARRMAELARQLRRLPAERRPDCRPLLRDGVAIFADGAETLGACEKCRAKGAVEAYMQRLNETVARVQQETS